MAIHNGVCPWSFLSEIVCSSFAPLLSHVQVSSSAQLDDHGRTEENFPTRAKARGLVTWPPYQPSIQWGSSNSSQLGHGQIGSKIKENSNTVRHLNNGTDHRHSKSCCDQSSPARRTIKWLISVLFISSPITNAPYKVLEFELNYDHYKQDGGHPLKGCIPSPSFPTTKVWSRDCIAWKIGARSVTGRSWLTRIPLMWLFMDCLMSVVSVTGTVISTSVDTRGLSDSPNLPRISRELLTQLSIKTTHEKKNCSR